MALLEVCAAGAIDEEDVMRFDQGDQSFAVYRRTEDDYCATDGLCTHEAIHLPMGW